jgi:phytoene synthase
MTQHSFAACREITRRANSSFPLAFRLLPPHKRRAMSALYAFSRLTDDLTDEPGEAAVQRAKLARWRAAIADALAGRSTHPIHPALHDTVARFAIPPRLLFDIIDGVETDLEPVRFATFADLYPYCYRVASAVGLACVRVWGLRAGATWEEADGPAEAAGVAFQLTNILRDLGEDAARGRVYLPTEELERFGCEPGLLLSKAATSPSPPTRRPTVGDLPHQGGGEEGAARSLHLPPGGGGRPAQRAGWGGDFDTLLRFQVERARDYYRRSEPLDRLLTPDGRAIFRVMAGTYRALLDEVERLGPGVLTTRARVPRWRKGLIFLSAWPIKWGWV